MSGYTKGPWQAEKRDWKGEPSEHNVYISGDIYEDWGDDEDDENAEMTTVGTGVAVVLGNATSGEVTKANARLIASSPDLLAALVELVRLKDHRPDDYEARKLLAWEAARAAIARATGATP